MKRKVYTDGNGGTRILIDGLGVYVPQPELYELKAQVEQLQKALSAPKSWPEKCPITMRDLFMEIDGVPTYGGPFDSYSIPLMDGQPTDPWHERELYVKRFDHDVGGWVDDETIPLRIISEDVLFDLQDKAEQLEVLRQSAKEQQNES